MANTERANPLELFLKGHECPKGAPFTHSRIPGNGLKGCTYHIPEDELETFMKVYYEDVFVRGNRQSLLEANSQPYSHLRVDLDFKFARGTFKHQHTQDQVTAFVAAYMGNVTDLLRFAPGTVLKLYQMEKARPVNKGVDAMGDGVHCLLPTVGVNQAIHMQLRKLMLPEMAAIFGELPLLDKKWENVYDEAIYKGSNWQLYGSSKPDNQPYKVVRIYSYDTDATKITDIEAVDSSTFDTLENVKAMVARCLTADHSPPLTELGQRVLDEQARNAPVPYGGAGGPGGPIVAVRRPGGIDALYNEEVDEICSHVANVANSPDTHYEQWYRIGQALYNLGPDEPRFFEAFLEYSRRSPKHDEEQTRQAWRKFTFRQDGARVAAGTLRYLSKTSNAERYSEIQGDCLHTLIINAAMTANEEDVARVIRKMYPDRFRCTGGRDKLWYEFQGHTWKELRDMGMAVRSLFSTEVAGRFGALATQFSEQRDRQPMDSEDYERLDDLREKCEGMKNKLKKTGFKENVLKECAEKFYDCDFMEKLDENKMLLGCSNGVFDMTTLTFRDGQPDDFLSKCTHCVYQDKVPWTELPHAAELQKFLVDIQPDDGMRNYLLDFLASCLCGASYDELFHIMTGGGGNGKSLLFEHLMKSVLGDYFTLMPVSAATKKRGKSNEAAPELVNIKGARMVALKEPDEGEAMNTGMIKDLTPGDRITCRPLYHNPIEFEIQAKFLLMCNDKPKVNARDGGTWRRLRVMQFEVQFVDEPTEPHHRKKDGTLKRRINEWGETLLAMLIQHYVSKRGTVELKPPKRVLQYTNEYRNSNDGMAKFVADCIREAGHEDVDVDAPVENITKARLGNVLRDWKRENSEFYSIKLDDLVKHMEGRYGAYRPRLGWNNFMLINPYVD